MMMLLIVVGRNRISFFPLAQKSFVEPKSVFLGEEKYPKMSSPVVLRNDNN